MSAQQPDQIQHQFLEAVQRAQPTLAWLSRMTEESPELTGFEEKRLSEMAWELELISTTIRTELTRRGLADQPMDTA